VIVKALRSLPAQNRLENQIALTNRIIALLGEITGDTVLAGAALPAETEMLLAILARLNLPPAARAGDLAPVPHPALSESFRPLPLPVDRRRFIIPLDGHNKI
jgi:hypothetical protein